MEQYLRQAQAGDDLRTEVVRALGGIILGLGMIAVLIRRSEAAEPWGDFPLLLIVLIPALILYGGGILAARVAPSARPWHAVWVTFGIFFIFGSCQQFLTLIDGDPDAPLNTFWVFGLIAGAAVLSALWAGVRFGWLLAGLALSVSWLALWDELISDGLGSDIGTFRGLCMVAAGALIAGAYFATKRGVIKDNSGSEVFTAAGIIFVIGAGVVSIISLFAGLFFGLASPVGGDPGSIAEPSTFWDVVLLVGSLALVAAGTHVALRGPVYVGTAGLIIFVTIVGSDFDNPEADGSLFGWPILLLVLGIAAIAASVLVKQNASAPPE